MMNTCRDQIALPKERCCRNLKPKILRQSRGREAKKSQEEEKPLVKDKIEVTPPHAAAPPPSLWEWST